ncbi:MAG TPA: serine hydrolase [Anaerolineaceae bacterium]
MNSSPFIVFLRTIALGFILAAAGLAASQIPTYRQAVAVFPSGERIAGIPIGGLTHAQAAERVRQAYALPVEIHYQGGVIQASPEELGFKLDLDPLLAQADETLALGYWDYLWNRLPAAANLPLRASVDEARIRTYLESQVIPRYDAAPIPAAPVPAALDFTPGQSGTALDTADGVAQIASALRSTSARTVTLTAHPIDPPRPAFQNVEILLKQLLLTSGYQGLAEVYLSDLKTGERFDFAIRQGEDLPPGVAFSAASTMKIPVMISVLRRVPDPTPETISGLLQEMIEASDNPSTDKVAQTAIDEVRGPLEVTQDMQALGLKNTFWAGYFYDGAPLLQRFETPAGTRSDVSTQPDQYNQTIPAEIGSLLEDIYHCAKDGAGRLPQVFPGEITQAKCQKMVDLLKGNRLPVLIRAGVPEGTPIGHKHGWITGADGYVHNYSDVALVYSPGGDYVMAVYLYQPTQLLFDPANVLVSHLSTAVYNYFNLPAPAKPLDIPVYNH